MTVTVTHWQAAAGGAPEAEHDSSYTHASGNGKPESPLPSQTPSHRTGLGV